MENSANLPTLLARATDAVEQLLNELGALGSDKDSAQADVVYARLRALSMAVRCLKTIQDAQHSAKNGKTHDGDGGNDGSGSVAGEHARRVEQILHDMQRTLGGAPVGGDPEESLPV